MGRGLILIDGSSLFASIAQLKKSHNEFKDSQLDIEQFSGWTIHEWRNNIGEVVRITYYFKKNDPRIEKLLILPDLKIPGKKDHWRIIECGDPTDTIPEDQLQKLDPKWRDTYARAEKGLDTRIACDALVAAATSRANDFVFFINDRDYIPVLEEIQKLGCCAYLMGLDEAPPQKKLLDICDRYGNMSQYLKILFHVK